MLEIPAGLTVSLILLTLTTFVGFLFAVAFSKKPNISKYATWVSVPVLLWIIFQSTLSLNRWYMDRTTAHLLFPYLFTSVCILAVMFTPHLRAWVLGLRIEILIGLQLIRLPMEGLVHWAAYHRQAPLALTFYGGSLELLIAAATPIMLYLFRKDKYAHRLWLLIWSYAGAASLSMLWIRSLLSAPSSIQNWGFEIPNYFMVHFPGSWIATFIIPVLLFAHLATAVHLRNITTEKI
jgi:hypothetical protein